MLYVTDNNEICSFISSNKSDFNLKDIEGIKLFDNALKEKDKLERDKLLDNVYIDRKTKIEKEKLIKLPTGVFLRTPTLLKSSSLMYPDKLDDIKCNKNRFILPYFEVSSDNLYLYKVVSIFQLKDIYNNGLNSKYGGIGGASTGMTYMQTFDRGKMFIGTAKSAATRYMDSSIFLPVLIIIKIPVEMSYDINLASDFTDNGSHEVFFVGSIPFKYIYISQNNTEYELNQDTINSVIILSIPKVYDYEIKQFTPEQIKSFTPEQIKSFTPEQIKSFTPEQKQTLNAR